MDTAPPHRDSERRSKQLNHMGDVLLGEARTTAGPSADAMLRAARIAFDEALRLTPDMPEALVGLGSVHLAMASRTIDSAERDELLRRARQELLRAENLWGKAAAYNLARACALEGDLTGCRDWLERAKAELHLPPVAQVRTDPDLAAVRGEPWFAALLAP
jgi:hypothetical protein